MEKFKKVLQKRLVLAGLYNAVVLIGLGLGVVHFTTGSNEHIKDFIAGANLGVCVSIQVIVLFYTGKYLAAMKNDDKLKALYIAEMDERGKYIREKIGGTGLNIVICGLALGTITSGYLNETVFFTLLGATLFAALVKAALKMVYSKIY